MQHHVTLSSQTSNQNTDPKAQAGTFFDKKEPRQPPGQGPTASIGSTSQAGLRLMRHFIKGGASLG